MKRRWGFCLSVEKDVGIATENRIILHALN